jgi:hypothetical protein
MKTVCEIAAEPPSGSIFNQLNQTATLQRQNSRVHNDH